MIQTIMHALTTQRVARLAQIAGHMARHPRQCTEIPKWLRERKASTLDLRCPWWPYSAQKWVDATLPVGAAVFEFGGGGSTLWMQTRASKVYCVEHDRGWYEELSAATAENVSVIFVPTSDEGNIGTPVEPNRYFDKYVNVIKEQADESFDLIIVDGRARVACGIASLPKLKPGGMLLLDDSDRPQYSQLVKAIDHWPAFIATGLKPGAPCISQTTIWTKPSDC